MSKVTGTMALACAAAGLFAVGAKSRPDELTFSSGGSGSAEHVAGELSKQIAGIRITGGSS